MRAEDRAAFTDFVAVRAPSLLRFAYLLVGDTSEAEDLLQTAFSRLAGRWSRDITDPNAYVKRALVNLARDRWRWSRLHRRVDLSDAGWEAVSEPQPDHSLSVAENDELLRALRQLPRRQRLIIVLRYVDGLSEQQAAELADCSVGTVKSQSARGLARLRHLLSEPQPAALGQGGSPS